MKPEIKEMWIKALRSKDYRQGMGNLRSLDHGGPVFCCLGVLCDLHSRDQKSGTTGWGGVSTVQMSYMNCTGMLPEAVVIWAGLTDNIEKAEVGDDNTEVHVANQTGKAYEYDIIVGHRDTGYLSVLNDNGSTFQEISDLIEQWL